MEGISVAVVMLGARSVRLALEISLWTIVPILIVAVLAGVGSWAVRSAQGEAALATAATAGALSIIAVVAILNLFIPIPRGPGLAIVPVGLVALGVSARRLGIDRTVLLRVLPWALGATAVYRFGRRPLGYDAFLYHGAILEWLEREPVPQGFALFHTRFAFNPGLALLMAPFRSPGSDWSHHVLLEIAVVVIAAVTVAAMIHRARLAGNRPLLGLLLAVATLAGVFLMFRDVRVGMDLAAGMSVLAALTVGAALARPAVGHEQEDRSGTFVLLGLLVAFAVLQKTSSAPSVLLLLAPLAARGRDGAIRLRPVIPALSLALIAGIAMALRSWVMSGCLSYPVAFTCVDAAWTPGRDGAAAEAATILSWARSGTMNYPSVTDLAWIGDWYSNVELSTGFRVAAFATLVGVAVRITRTILTGRSADALPRILWVTVAALIGFWFVSAPDPRFGFPGLLALGALLLAPAFTIPTSAESRAVPTSPRVLPVVAVSVGSLVLVASAVLSTGRYFPFSGAVPHAMQSDSILGVAGTPDFSYTHPVTSDQCGDTFPCAPGPRDLTVERTGDRLVFRRAPQSAP